MLDVSNVNVHYALLATTHYFEEGNELGFKAFEVIQKNSIKDELGVYKKMAELIGKTQKMEQGRYSFHNINGQWSPMFRKAEAIKAYMNCQGMNYLSKKELLNQIEKEYSLEHPKPIHKIKNCIGKAFERQPLKAVKVVSTKTVHALDKICEKPLKVVDKANEVIHWQPSNPTLRLPVETVRLVASVVGLHQIGKIAINHFTHSKSLTGATGYPIDNSGHVLVGGGHLSNETYLNTILNHNYSHASNNILLCKGSAGGSVGQDKDGNTNAEIHGTYSGRTESGNGYRVDVEASGSRDRNGNCEGKVDVEISF